MLSYTKLYRLVYQCIVLLFDLKGAWPISHLSCMSWLNNIKEKISDVLLLNKYGCDVASKNFYNQFLLSQFFHVMNE